MIKKRRNVTEKEQVDHRHCQKFVKKLSTEER